MSAWTLCRPSIDRRQLLATSTPSVSRQIHTQAHPSPGKTAPTGAGRTGHDDTDSRHLGDTRRADWTATDGTKGRGDVGRRFLIISNRELEGGGRARRPNRA